MLELVGAVCVVIAVYAALRAVLEKNTLRKLPFVNVMNFAVAGVIALILPHPLTLAAAIAYFVGATLEANAIASALARLTPCLPPSDEVTLTKPTPEDEP
ncbi:MAG TPA: DUF2109 domain-containing protein [Methanocorpusculum sp.]|nr:DUF2109 domain-containing protein [Methanocorpusculum sp.]HJK80011.1 DUF2109 domain-containing protein [Methanocorpusculum sp.]